MFPCFSSRPSLADIADEANVQINQFDEFIDERQYVCAVAARGSSQFIQSAGTAFGPPGVLDQNRFTVSRELGNLFANLLTDKVQSQVVLYKLCDSPSAIFPYKESSAV